MRDHGRFLRKGIKPDTGHALAVAVEALHRAGDMPVSAPIDGANRLEALLDQERFGIGEGCKIHVDHDATTGLGNGMISAP